MAEKSREWSEEKFRVGDAELHVLKGGKGKPLLVFHGELGHPGFGRSPITDWIMDVRDLASFYSRLIREQSLAPADVIGFSLGGWLAAEMAVSNAQQFSKMILVGATGLRPPQGEIMDMFTVTARRYLNRTVLDPRAETDFQSLSGGEQTPGQFGAWEAARGERARLA